MSVKLRYVELEPNKIFNQLAPKNISCWLSCEKLRDSWCETETIILREKFEKYYIEEFDRITDHFSKLEKSILVDGIKHPICAVTGPLRKARLHDRPHTPISFLPAEFRSAENIKNLIYSHTFGGSRLSIAQKYNIMVPCVVHDFSNLFEDCEEVTNKNFSKWFGNHYRFVNDTPYIRLHTHSHIDNKKYNGMTGETKKAQQAAKAFAKGKINV